MEKNQALYESMKQNKSLAPIAELGALVGDAQRMAQKAEEIGNTLSVFAVKGRVPSPHCRQPRSGCASATPTRTGQGHSRPKSMRLSTPHASANFKTNGGLLP